MRLTLPKAPLPMLCFRLSSWKSRSHIFTSNNMRPSEAEEAVARVPLPDDFELAAVLLVSVKLAVRGPRLEMIEAKRGSLSTRLAPSALHANHRPADGEVWKAEFLSYQGGMWGTHPGAHSHAGQPAMSFPFLFCSPWRLMFIQCGG